MKAVHVSGKRKKAIARATARQGTGIVRVNNLLLDAFQPDLARIKMREPLLLADDAAAKIDIDVNVAGGGITSQAEAARLAISKAIVDITKSDKLRKIFLAYDRHLLIADVRQREPCKPNDSKARDKRQKSYR